MTRPLHPPWEELSRSLEHWRGEAVVDPGLAVLDGHFPGKPIVPGVAQIFWAGTLARRVFPNCDLTSELRNLKFVKAIIPRVRLRISLARIPGKTARIAFEYSSAAGAHSRGQFLCQP